MNKCIVFDIDRTLVDSYKPELLSLQEAIEIVTGNKLNEESFNRLTTLTTNEFFKSLNLSNDQINLINKEWEKTFSKYKTTCFTGIKEVIKRLNSNNYTIGIITSRTINEYHELDDELIDIADYFKSIITSDKVNNPKPNRESIDILCNELNCTTDDIIYIGDSYIDKLFADNCNIKFIPACWENKDLIEEKDACLSPEDILLLLNKD